MNDRRKRGIQNWIRGKKSKTILLISWNLYHFILISFGWLSSFMICCFWPENAYRSVGFRLKFIAFCWLDFRFYYFDNFGGRTLCVCVPYSTLSVNLPITSIIRRFCLLKKWNKKIIGWVWCYYAWRQIDTQKWRQINIVNDNIHTRIHRFFFHLSQFCGYFFSVLLILFCPKQWQ